MPSIFRSLVFTQTCLSTIILTVQVEVNGLSSNSITLSHITGPQNLLTHSGFLDAETAKDLAATNSTINEDFLDSQYKIDKDKLVHIKNAIENTWNRLNIFTNDKEMIKLNLFNLKDRFLFLLPLCSTVIDFVKEVTEYQNQKLLSKADNDSDATISKNTNSNSESSGNTNTSEFSYLALESESYEADKVKSNLIVDTGNKSNSLSIIGPLGNIFFKEFSQRFDQWSLDPTTVSGVRLYKRTKEMAIRSRHDKKDVIENFLSFVTNTGSIRRSTSSGLNKSMGFSDVLLRSLENWSDKLNEKQCCFNCSFLRSDHNTDGDFEIKLIDLVNSPKASEVQMPFWHAPQLTFDFGIGPNSSHIKNQSESDKKNYIHDFLEQLKADRLNSIKSNSKIDDESKINDRIEQLQQDLLSADNVTASKTFSFRHQIIFNFRTEWNQYKKCMHVNIEVKEKLYQVRKVEQPLLKKVIVHLQGTVNPTTGTKGNNIVITKAAFGDKISESRGIQNNNESQDRFVMNL